MTGGGILGVPIIVPPTISTERRTRSGVGGPGSPKGYRLDDSLSGQIGATAQLGERIRGHLCYAYAQAISPMLADQQSLAAGLTIGIAKKTTVVMYGSAGLSRGAPDVVAGLRIGLRLE